MLSILASFAQEEARSVSENMLWRIQQNPFKQGTRVLQDDAWLSY